jgi:DNA (cytosine-5)-methyltransferase 1
MKQTTYVSVKNRPRRITPIEALRLQGFPDDYLINVPGYSDTQAYRAIGNSKAVPVVRWIGERIKRYGS